MCADILSHHVPYTSNKIKGAIAVVQERNAIDNRPENGLLNKPAMEPDWSLAGQVYKQDEVIEVTITGYNKGGLLTNWGGLPGFLPASQLENFPECHLASKRLKALSDLVGRHITVKIIELNPATSRLILSERAASVAADVRDRILHEIKVGDMLHGRVTNLAEFGVFIDLGGVEGLIHISELSWGRVIHPSDILEPGEDVEVIVLQVEPETERIALSRKQLLSNPWQGVAERYQPGQVVQGIITNIARFGAFAEVEEGLEGLIHVSEMSDKDVSNPYEVLKKGELVLARVLQVDGPNRRLALSLKNNE